jgi:3-phosphoshikimate 1-carboxyvinyltransferase
MTIQGGNRLQGGAIKSYADHRIAMSFAIAGLVSASGVGIDDAACVDISLPSFFALLAEICLH